MSEQDASRSLVAWHLVLQVSTRVVREFERRFDLEHRLSAREFDVLINLANAPEGHLRMTELADATLLSSGGLTRLAGRLEGRGLIRRDPDPGDARSYHARLTEQGRKAYAAARTTHDAIVRELFGAHLSDPEVDSLCASLSRVLGDDLRA
jgi:DNA-binding MarR family transcriptional regulator